MSHIPKEQQGDADRSDESLADAKLSNSGEQKSPTAAQQRRVPREEEEEDPFGSDEPE